MKNLQTTHEHVLVRCCAWNVRSLSVIVSDTCAVYTRFIDDSDHAQPQKMTNFSTNNHAQTNFMRDLCVIGNGTGTLEYNIKEN